MQCTPRLPSLLHAIGSESPVARLNCRFERCSKIPYAVLHFVPVPLALLLLSTWCTVQCKPELRTLLHMLLSASPVKCLSCRPKRCSKTACCGFAAPVPVSDAAYLVQLILHFLQLVLLGSYLPHLRGDGAGHAAERDGRVRLHSRKQTDAARAELATSAE